MSEFPEIPNYTILQKLGEGGMADVYLAEHKRNRRRSAIKIMRYTGQLSDAENEELFQREGEVLASFSDRNIVTIYDNDKVGDTAYLAMEFISGGTLLDRMAKPIAVGEAIGLIVQIASALGAAHKRGIVHRDLKPENILMRDETTPVLTDFGASRVANRSTIFSKGGGTVGTPTYMSPEQITGQELDGRSDLYALGILFYELLVGHRPFRGGSFTEIASQHLYAPIPALPEELAPLQTVVSTLLAKSANQRYSTAQNFIDALRACVLGEATLRRQVAHVALSGSWVSQLRALGFIIESNEKTEIQPLLTMPPPEQADPGAGPPRRRAGEYITGPMQAVTGPSKAAHPAAERKPPWIALVIVAIALLLVGGGYLLWTNHQRTQAAPQAAEAKARYVTARTRFETVARQFDESPVTALRPAEELATEAERLLQQSDFAGGAKRFAEADRAVREAQAALLESLVARYKQEAQAALEAGDVERAESALRRAEQAEAVATAN